MQGEKKLFHPSKHYSFCFGLRYKGKERRIWTLNLLFLSCHWPFFGYSPYKREWKGWKHTLKIIKTSTFAKSTHEKNSA